MKKESNCIVLLSHDGINSASAGVATYMQTYINAFHKILMEVNHGSNREKISNIDSEEFLQRSNRQFDFFLITTELKDGCSFKDGRVYAHNKNIVNDLNGDIFEVDINSGGISNYGLDDDVACDGWNIGSRNAAEVIKNRILSKKDYENVYVFANDTVFLGVSKYLDLMGGKIKIISIPHSTEICHKTNIKGREEYEKTSFLSKNTFKIGYVSDYFKRHLIEDYGVDEKVLVPMKCTIAKESPRFKYRTDGEIEEELIKYNIPLDKKLVTFVGRIDPVKGVEETIRFFNLMNQEIEGLHLVIQGFSYYENDPYIDRLKDLIRSYGIANYSFLSKLSLTLPPCLWQYRNTLINLYLSKNEPFGLTSIEARYMARNTGLIAVNSNIDGLGEQTEDGYNGFLCGYGDEEDYRRVIDIIKKAGEADLQRIRDNSYRDLLDKYDTEKSLRNALKEIGTL